MRIAMARLQSAYPFDPQRVAVASKMYSCWVDRKNAIRKKEEERKLHILRILKRKKNG